MNTNELQHYGVKGMKWGVRRYQNYDGSYTQRGMKRYRKAEARYDEADAKRKAAKESGDKAEAKNQRVKMRNAHNEMNKAYRQLKRDKLADEGKRLYSEGKTVQNLGGLRLRSAAIQMVANSGAVAVANALSRSGVDRQAAAGVGTAISLGTAAVNTVLYADAKRTNKRLRAYYAH